MKRAKGKLGYYFSYHFSQKKGFYFGFLIALSVGLILGIVLHFTTSLGGYLLSDKDQHIFDFITKDASILDFFFSKLLDIVIAFVLIFVFSLSIYSSILVFVFFAYQGMILGSVCCQIISSYAFLGVLNVFLILIPINLCLFALLFYEASICVSRASFAKKYNMDFKSSFYYERGYFKQLGLGLGVTILFLLAVTLVLSIVLRAVTFVAY